MRILQINLVYGYGSTGRIMMDLSNKIISTGNSCYNLCAYSNQTKSNILYITDPFFRWFSIRKNYLINRLTGLTGYMDIIKTKRVLSWIDDVHPDIIHLHNIHGDWINLGMLMAYIREKKIPVVWTLHDCWAFTGRCSHFENNNCFKWIDGCHHCIDKEVYPTTYFFDFSKKMWKDKIKWFGSLPCVSIVTPSKWLAGYVKQSMLRGYDISTINNGIDLTLFMHTSTWSKYLPTKDNRKIILGVAASWTERKGLNDIIKLHSIMDKRLYLFVVVGLNFAQKKNLPKGIIGIERTTNVNELSELYSNADVFINPTYQDNYPTVNLEAIACGTPVITYQTGGSVESVPESVGIVVPKGDLKEMEKAIMVVCESQRYNKDVCRNFAEENFDKNKKYEAYIDLYKSILRL